MRDALRLGRPRSGWSWLVILFVGDRRLGFPAEAQGSASSATPASRLRRRPGQVTMPTKIEKDAVTGQDTTGHEWDGIKELNTPLPKWWLYVLYATIVWAAV